MNYSESLTEFNNFDKNFDKINNTYDNYVSQAENYLYFRNLKTTWTMAELKKLLFDQSTFRWHPSIIGDLFIGTNSIFNLLFNEMNQYFNPEVIFNRNGLNHILINESNEIHVASVENGLTYKYDFLITF
jgi:hypothetical protein